MQRIYRRGVSHPFWECKGCGVRIGDSELRRRFCDAFNDIAGRRADHLPQLQLLHETGTPLERLRARQMMAITAKGPIPFEVPELTRCVLREAWIGMDGSLEFIFHVQ